MNNIGEIKALVDRKCFSKIDKLARKINDKIKADNKVRQYIAGRIYSIPSWSYHFIISRALEGQGRRAHNE